MAGSSWCATGWARSRSSMESCPHGGLAFGSEPKAVLAHPGIGRAPRPREPGALPVLRIRSRALLDLAIVAKAPPRTRPLLGRWLVAGLQILAAAAESSSQRARLRDGVRAILGRAPRRGRAPPALGRADRRFSLRRHRFLERRRRPLRNRARPERPHVLDRL